MSITARPAAATRQLGAAAGVTLIEMIVVVAIIAIMAAIMFPSATSGIDSIRLASAADSTAAFLSSAVNRVERRQVMIELTVSKPENALYIRAVPNFERRFELPDGIVIVGVLPELQNDDNSAPRRFLMFPGGSPPRVGVRIMNRRGGQRMVSLDPITGVPVIERLANGQ